MISKSLNKIKKIYGEVYGRYPLTTILVIIATLYGSAILLMWEDIGSKTEDIVMWWLMFILYLLPGVFCVEALRKRYYENRPKLKKTVGIVICVAISMFLLTALDGKAFGTTEVEIFKGILSEKLLAWTVAYFVVCVLLILYNRYKESGSSAEKYFVSVMSDSIKLLVSWGILALGMLILSLIYDELISSSYDDSIYAIPQILICGLYVAPCVMMNLTEIKEEIDKFFENLIKYALLILTIIGAAIIYIYIIKTVITGIPSNEIFTVTSILFFAAIPVGFSCTAFEKNTVLQKIAYVLPYIYAPFIILQVYSVGARISEYGVTPSRYMGIVLIILEILYTIVYAFGRQHIDKLILAMLAVTIVVAIVPGTNVLDVSKYSQMKEINRYIESGLPETRDEAAKLKGAYIYLKSIYGKDYFSEILTNNQVRQLNAIETDKEQRSEIVSCELNDETSIIPTAGYDYVTDFSKYLFFNDDNVKDTPENIMLVVDDKEFGPINMKGIFDSLMLEPRDSNYVCIPGSRTVKISEDCEVVFKNIRISKDLVTEEYTYVSLRGYIRFNEGYVAYEQ